MQGSAACHARKRDPAVVNVSDIRSLIASGAEGMVSAPPASKTEDGPPGGPGSHVHYFPTVDSTNTKARELAADGAPAGTVVIAGVQTAGRGRQGRSWTSDPGKNLLASVILRPRIDPARLGIVSLWASVSAAACVTSASGMSAGCKWPNDVMLSGKKICGILSESVLKAGGADAEAKVDSVDAVILGIGLNVNQTSFPALNATSLRLVTGRDHDLAAVLCSLLAELGNRYSPVASGRGDEVIREWTDRSVIIGSKVEVERGGESFGGVALGLTPAGALRVETAGGTVEVSAGEVSLR